MKYKSTQIKYNYKHKKHTLNNGIKKKNRKVYTQTIHDPHFLNKHNKVLLNNSYSKISCNKKKHTNTVV